LRTILNISNKLRSQAAFFEILSKEESEALDKSLEQIVSEKKPSEASHHVLRASVFFSHGLMEDAIEETQKALEIESQNPTLHSILARLYAEVGRTDEAISSYGRIIEQQ